MSLVPPASISEEVVKGPLKPSSHCQEEPGSKHGSPGCGRLRHPLPPRDPVTSPSSQPSYSPSSSHPSAPSIVSLVAGQRALSVSASSSPSSPLRRHRANQLPPPSYSSSIISAASFYPPELRPTLQTSESVAECKVGSTTHKRVSISRLTKTLHLEETDSNMQGVDENIYHWKVLNLSRAKLKASSRTSALLSGFAMVAMVEIQIDEEVPEPLLITFVICTVLLIAVHMLALMISTCILPNVEAVANLHYQTQKTVFESPHMKMNFIVELAWAFSTVLGILLFLVEICILCWVKFYGLTHRAAWVATGLLIPILIIFVAFAAHFYLRLVSHKSEVYEDGIKELQLLKDQLLTEEDDRPGHGNGSASARATEANMAGSPSAGRRGVQVV